MTEEPDKIYARLIEIQSELGKIERKLTTLIEFQKERIVGIEKHLGINK